MTDWFDNPSYDWIDRANIAWSATLSGSIGATLYQLWADSDYVYNLTSSGLNILEIPTSYKGAYLDYLDGFSTVWGSTTTIYLGTYTDGIKYINKEDITTDNLDPIDLTSMLMDYNYFYQTSSTTIKHLHGNNNTIAAVTSFGINILNNDGVNSFKSSFSNVSVTKCFMSTNNKLYYVVQGTESDGVFRINSALCDWSTADNSYLVGGTFIPESVVVNDIFATSSTSENNIDNTLFIATTSGVIVVDEGTSEHNIYYFNSAPFYSEGGGSNIATAVWADADTSRLSGKMYVVTSGTGAALSVVDLANQKLYDSYTLTHKGRANETLLQNNTTDIIVG